MVVGNDRDLFAIINVFHSTSLETSFVRKICLFMVVHPHSV